MKQVIQIKDLTIHTIQNFAFSTGPTVSNFDFILLPVNKSKMYHTKKAQNVTSR